MNAPLIYVDFDDVLCETAQAFLDVVEREFGRSYAFDDIRFFDLEKSFDLNAQEYEYLMDLLHDPDMLIEMEPMAGALEVLTDWANRNIEIAIVTGRPPETETVCHDWLARHEFPYDRILFVDKYGRTPSHQVGSEVIAPQDIAPMGFDLAVEDAPAMISFLVDQSDIPIAILDRPWNRNLDLAGSISEGRVVRCADWQCVAAALNVRARYWP